MNVRELVDASYQCALEHGWHEGEFNIPEKLALIHSEVSEALEDYRTGAMHMTIDPDTGKPNGFPVEIADVVIRVADLCGRLGIDLESVIRTKHEYNKSRSYRHGGKRA